MSLTNPPPRMGILLRRLDFGVFCVKILAAFGARRQATRRACSHAKSGGDTMKDARLKTASGALAQVLAVAALLVIAGVIFYAR